MDAESPQTCGKGMSDDNVDIDRHEIATSEHRHSLDESVKRMEGKTSEGSDCFGSVMNDMYLLVDGRMMEQTVSPVGHELVVTDMKKKVKDSRGGYHKLILNF